MKASKPWVVWIRYRSGWKPVLRVTLVPGSNERSPREWLRRFKAAYDDHRTQVLPLWPTDGSSRLLLRPEGQVPKEARQRHV